MSDVHEKLSGVFPPVCTPFSKKDEEVSYEALGENIDKMNDTDLRGYFVLGTNAEYKSLDTREKFGVVETVLKHRASNKVLMAGAGLESTKKTVDFAKQLADMGVELVSLLMPHFFAKKIDDDVLVRYITEVADSISIPVVLYNNPAVAAGVSISTDVLNTVATHPNVIGIKESSKQSYAETAATASDQFVAMAGSASFFWDMLKKGGSGGVLSLANVVPQVCADLYAMFREGRIEDGDALNEDLVTLNKQVSGAYGVAGVKAAMDAAGFTGGDPRRPLTALSPEQRAELAETVTGSPIFSQGERT